ncbi:hypothetical protein COU13_00055 [Candidatus Kaiserbacteria bacterium CG10_big_fil_rev_8_21_14_0_10_43_70]|uniref:Uncharacterized protein n=1 Tax=Candidatus Kaiserbacteria bacterium CG10_big_fil_rev_8_21_14_0_10_43_70 TaxID=1974605 RepID=A0A2H0ULE5_9BACT|nr:MAG: hypothetical protein COU13_00055 [Candidatus Kaiserbacteria bacterium CG10_big_fil_rev_8_21_14_0_10_43_70]
MRSVYLVGDLSTLKFQRGEEVRPPLYGRGEAKSQCIVVRRCMKGESEVGRELDGVPHQTQFGARVAVVSLNVS